MTYSLSDNLIMFGVHIEYTFDKKWCFKHQFWAQEVLIISDADKDKAASKFFVEYLKGIHYELKYLFENDKNKVDSRISHYLSLNDENISQTIKIFKRQYNIK